MGNAEGVRGSYSSDALLRAVGKAEARDEGETWDFVAFFSISFQISVVPGQDSLVTTALS